MLNISWPSLPSLNIFSSSPRQAIKLPPAKVHETETAHQKPARALKHLLKLDHVENGLFDRRQLPSQMSHVSILLAAILWKFPAARYLSQIMKLTGL